MTTPKLSPQASTDFWGKDGLVPFVGQVEDVNDPKQSGRVRVRCVGWHTKDKKELPTENLPWSHVGMPTTHAMQARIGGKHGLLNGCWVMGIFLDGQEAQKPFIMNTFNFVANSTDEDNKVETQGEDGTDQEGDIAFRNTMISPQTQEGNYALRMTDENAKGYGGKTDKAGNYLTSDADNPCHGKKASQSKASKEIMDGQQTKYTPTAHNANTRQADSMCGDVPHAVTDIQMKIQETLAVAQSRFTYGDIVWDNFSGNYIDLNGVFAQLTFMICNSMKGNLNSKKALANERFRSIHSTIIGPGGFTLAREWSITEVKDITASDTSDIFNAMYQMIIDALCPLIMSMLQGINNHDNGNQPPDSPEIIGANPITNIENGSSVCIASTVVDNVNTLSDQWIELALELSNEAAENQAFNMGSLGAIFNIISSASGILKFLIQQHYTGKRAFHNITGDASQDLLTKSKKCRMDRIYNTEMGAMSSLMGLVDALSGESSGSNTGGGSGSGSSNNNNFADRLELVGFGGLAADSFTGETRTEVCEGATTPVEPDPGPDPEPGPTPTPTPGPGPTPTPTPGPGPGPTPTPGPGPTPTPTPPGPGPGPNPGPGPGPGPVPCGPDGACPEGYTCVDGTCVPGTPCGPGGTCPAGYVCVDGICLPEKPISCNENNDCPSGYVCVGGVCVPEDAEILDPGTSTKDLWVTCCGDVSGPDVTYVSSGGNRARAGNCFVTATSSLDAGGLMVTAGGEGGIPVTIKGIPVVAGGVGGTPVYAGRNRLATSYGVGVSVGATGGIPVKCGASTAEVANRIIVVDTASQRSNVLTKPAGSGASVIGVPLPSADPVCARNFVQGTPNQAVIIRPGEKYFFNNRRNGRLVYPSIFIPEYQGAPVPVVDPVSGELVAVLTNCAAWSANKPNPAISVIPDNNSIGITTNDPRYDITIGGFYIGNTGFDYRNPMMVINDRDAGGTNGEVELITREGRIVDYSIINSGTGFRRIPEIEIKEKFPDVNGSVSGGYGARIYPIMNVVNKYDPNQPSKVDLPPVQYIFCPGNEQRNLY